MTDKEIFTKCFENEGLKEHASRELYLEFTAAYDYLKKKGNYPKLAKVVDALFAAGMLYGKQQETSTPPT